jgi:hypothetical protein
MEAKSEVQTHRHNVTKIQEYYEIIFNYLTVVNDSIIGDIWPLELPEGRRR